jgi:hypothetical protein
MLADNAKELPTRQFLFLLPCLLAIAVLCASLFAPQGHGPDRSLHDPASLTALVPQKVPLPKKADGPPGTPTCSSCGEPMVARRNRDTDEQVYVCKSPDCRRAITGAEKPAGSMND